MIDEAEDTGTQHHPAQTGFAGEYGSATVHLGDGVGIRWATYEGETVGGILSHPRDDAYKGRCEGYFAFRGNIFDVQNPDQQANQWDFDGNYDSPTLSPSFLCHCGFHGFVRGGKWVPA